jgi:hypothetical protein
MEEWWAVYCVEVYSGCWRECLYWKDVWVLGSLLATPGKGPGPRPGFFRRVRNKGLSWGKDKEAYGFGAYISSKGG